MGRPVPYTKVEDLSAEDLAYLGDRIAKGPKIAEFLKFGEVQNDLRQITQKLDQDTGVTDTDYETVLGED